MAVRVYHDAYRSRGEAVMRTFLIAFTAVVLLAGYAVQPPEKTVPYKVTLQDGESVWDACAKVASSKDDVREVVYNALKENHHTLVSPIHNWGYLDYEMTDQVAAIGDCVNLLLRCDALVLTGRWETSAGCRAEYIAAKVKGLPIFTFYGDDLQSI